MKLFYIAAILIMGCKQPPECNYCDVEEFTGIWWQVEADNEALDMVINDSCYIFYHWEIRGREDSVYEEFDYLYGYNENKDPKQWFVSEWTFNSDSQTFFIAEEYSLSLHGQSEECYDISTNIGGTTINGLACPCESRQDGEIF